MKKVILAIGFILGILIATKTFLRECEDLSNEHLIIL